MKRTILSAALLMAATVVFSQSVEIVSGASERVISMPVGAEVSYCEDEATPLTVRSGDAVESFSVVAGDKLVFVPGPEKKVSLTEGEYKDENGNVNSWKLPMEIGYGNTVAYFPVFKNNPTDLSSLVKVGAVLRLYVTGTSGQLFIKNSKWGDLTHVYDWDVATEEEVFEVVLTQEIVDAFTMDEGSDLWLIITGDRYVLNRVTLDEE